MTCGWARAAPQTGQMECEDASGRKLVGGGHVYAMAAAEVMVNR